MNSKNGSKKLGGVELEVYVLVIFLRCLKLTPKAESNLYQKKDTQNTLLINV
jgi:hypothetical protein